MIYEMCSFPPSFSLYGVMGYFCSKKKSIVVCNVSVQTIKIKVDVAVFFFSFPWSGNGDFPSQRISLIHIHTQHFEITILIENFIFNVSLSFIFYLYS
jgi:hypothetical protein